MSRRIALCALAVLFVAAPAFAGTLYVPLAVDRQMDGEHQRTLVWVTNPTGQLRSFSARFIPTDTPGNQAGTTTNHNVPPWGTIVISPAPGNGLGIAEITAPDQLVFVGELNSFDNGQLVDSTEVPLVGSQNLVPANAMAHLQALERETVGTRTNLGIVNFGVAPASCTVRGFRPGGAPLADTATVTVKGLGHVEFPDAFGILGVPAIDGARFEVRCDRPFFPYGAIYGEFPDFVKFVRPSTTGQSNLVPPDNRPPNDPPPNNPPPNNPPPSDPPPNNPPPTDGGGATSGELMRRDGAFFHADRNNGAAQINLPIARGQNYNSLTIDFDMASARFPTNLYTGTVALLRPVRGGTYFAHTIRGDRGKSILDMGIGAAMVHRGENNVWQPNSTHHVRVHYDFRARRITWELFRNGQVVERIVGGMNNRNPLRHGGEGIQLVFGLSKVYDGAFYPPWGFRFSNLVVRGNAA
ncbi:MAG TPA: hypothetical protein VHQ65_16690 [Thermoanaerobaculia bacterium]|nr:hypothetical protein [Thermoanaerobaculia bacterium]